MNVCFVILHYLTSDDTLSCVRSIRKIEMGENARIVIVNNASYNNSMKEVEKELFLDKNIFYISNSSNLGFAKGNNVGYVFAKNKLSADFIVILNNDTLIKQRDFIPKMIDSYQKNQYAILGPDIISLTDHGHQNPMGSLPMMENEVKREIRRYQMLLVLSKLHMYPFLQQRISKETKPKISANRSEKKQEQVMLHGACLVFSPLFLRKMDKAFCPDTFLYMEEMILYQICMANGLKMLYDPSLIIYHQEDSATNYFVSKAKKKREFLFSHMIQSLKVYIHWIP